MKMSYKKTSELYSSISDPVMDLRIEIGTHEITRNDLDNKLFKLQSKIWERVHKTLNLESIK